MAELQYDPSTSEYAGTHKSSVLDELTKVLAARNRKQADEDLRQREGLAQKLEDFSKDPRYQRYYDLQERAHKFSVQIHNTPYDKKLPKHMQFDDKIGDYPIMSMLWGTISRREMRRTGEPPEPAQPKDPGMPAPPGIAAIHPPPGSPGGTPDASSAGIPPPPDAMSAGQPGGEQLGPNQITTAPAISGGGGDAVPPPPSDAGPSSAFDPIANARFQASIDAAKGGMIPATAEMAEALGVPEGTPVSPKDVMLRHQQTMDRATKAMLSGIDPDTGQPLPWKQQMNEATNQLKSAQAEAQKAIAAGKPDEAAAVLTRANAAMIAANAAMERAHNPLGQVTVIPIVDAQGNVTGTYGAPKTPGFTPAAAPEGSRKVALPAGELDKRTMATSILDGLDKLESLGRKHQDKIGFFTGRLAAAKVKVIGDTPEVNELFRLSDDIADQLLRARSGAQINEQEYSRLRVLVPDARSPKSKFFSDLNGFREEVKRILGTRTSIGKSGSVPPPPGSVVTKTFTSGPFKGKTGVSHDGGKTFDVEH